jgi:hypothetical protein
MPVTRSATDSRGSGASKRAWNQDRRFGDDFEFLQSIHSIRVEHAARTARAVERCVIAPGQLAHRAPWLRPGALP